MMTVTIPSNGDLTRMVLSGGTQCVGKGSSTRERPTLAYTVWNADWLQTLCG
jgi:hypothetical protein